jgi:hypothetical protein
MTSNIRLGVDKTSPLTNNPEANGTLYQPPVIVDKKAEKN